MANSEKKSSGSSTELLIGTDAYRLFARESLHFSRSYKKLPPATQEIVLNQIAAIIDQAGVICGNLWNRVRYLEVIGEIEIEKGRFNQTIEMTENLRELLQQEGLSRESADTLIANSVRCVVLRVQAKGATMEQISEMQVAAAGTSQHEIVPGGRFHTNGLTLFRKERVV